eukprot:GABV01001713.1.p1 GENE.GABV01001713.1~~GABV01001713.1.p1  ORF type:complete len:215 (+),score=91.24 GABV01001713.1:38-646(+)
MSEIDEVSIAASRGRRKRSHAQMQSDDDFDPTAASEDAKDEFDSDFGQDAEESDFDEPEATAAEPAYEDQYEDDDDEEEEVVEAPPKKKRKTSTGGSRGAPKIDKLLAALDKKQVISWAKEFFNRHPELVDEAVAALPQADFSKINKELTVLSNKVGRAFPYNRYGPTKHDTYSFNRVKSHLGTFKARSFGHFGRIQSYRTA